MRAATGEPEPEPEAERVCFVCSGGSDAEKGEVIKNCRCRGDAGFVHLSCLARVVRVVGAHRKGRWESCPSCGHSWSGPVSLHLARARHEIAKATRDEDELLLATLQLTAALKENGEYAEALRLGREALGDRLQSVHSDAAEMLAAHRPTLAIIAYEAVNAPPVIRAALEAGSHVLAEKPACISASDMEALVVLAKSKERSLMLALANRVRPEVQKARELVTGGALGQVNTAPPPHSFPGALPSLCFRPFQ